MGPTSAENRGTRIYTHDLWSLGGRCRHTPGCGGPTVLSSSKASCGVRSADPLGITWLESSGQSLAGCTFGDLDGQGSNPYFQLRQASSEDLRTRGWSGAGTQTSPDSADLPGPAPHHCWHVPSKCCSVNKSVSVTLKGTNVCRTKILRKPQIWGWGRIRVKYHY